MLQIKPHGDLVKAIHRSQHCQRNWDLTKTIPAEDMEVLFTAATQCPSKQNVAFYKLHFITRRDIIEQIHANTDGFSTDLPELPTVTNSQTLANLLVVFESQPLAKDSYRNQEIQHANGIAAAPQHITVTENLLRDQQMAVGIAAGYLNITASLMGYHTGCCACFWNQPIREILHAENDILLMMGIGFKDETRNRRIHEKDSGFVFPTFEKQLIPVNFIG
jgi:nitroreductase